MVPLEYIYDCQPLDMAEYESARNLNIEEARDKIGLETDLLRTILGLKRDVIQMLWSLNA